MCNVSTQHHLSFHTLRDSKNHNRSKKPRYTPFYFIVINVQFWKCEIIPRERERIEGIGLQIQFSILETSNQMEFNLSYPWQTALTQKIVDTSKCELVKESHRCWVIGSKGCAMQVRIFAFSQIFIILKTIKNVKNHP